MMRKMSRVTAQKSKIDASSDRDLSSGKCACWLMATTGLLAMYSVGVMAKPNFGSVTIASEPDHDIAGYTGGTVSIAAISPHDRRNRPCIGYAGDDPDHILVFENRVSSITIEVNSGEDTTLLIRDPNGNIYCGDDEGNGSDAQIRGQNWSSGNYEVWVGTFLPGERYDYTLRVNQ